MVRTVLITGANRGIGLAFTEHYTEAGWQVIAAARNIDSANNLKALKPWKLLTLDVSNESSILNAASSIKDVPIDILINNAGILDKGNLQDTTKESLMRQFEVNAVGSFLISRAFVSNLKLAAEASGGATIAQITSRMGSIQDNSSGAYYGYRASKSALNSISKSLAIDLANDNITTLILHPGYVSTDMTAYSGTVDPATSVCGLTKIISEAKPRDSGKFYHFEGQELPW